MDDFTIIGYGAVGHALGEIFSRGGTSWSIVSRNQRLPISKCYIVCTKAYEVSNVLHFFCDQFAWDSSIILATNGHMLGAAESLQNARGDLSVCLAVVTFGSFEEAGKYHFVNMRPGTFLFGSVQKKHVEHVKTASDRALLATSEIFAWSSEIVERSQEKWLFNTVINTAAASMRLPRNGLLLNYPELLQELFQESYELGLECFRTWPKSRSELWASLLRLIEDTADNENSMARDLRLGKKTESEFLAGRAVGRNGFPLLKQLHGYLSL